MKKIVKTLIVLFIGLLFFPKAALGFGITPAEIYVEDLKPGGHLEREIFVTRQPDEVNEELDVVLETDLGEMESWFSFDPGRQFPFPLGKNVTSFKVMVDVPKGVDIRNFDGRITAKGTTGKKASTGVTIVKGAILGIDITTSDSDAAELKVLSMQAPDVNQGDPVRLLVNVENVGNIAAALDEVNMEVMDLFEKPIESLSDTTLPPVEPFTTQEFEAQFNSELEKGQYRVDASAVFMGEEIFRKKMILTVNAKPAQIDEQLKEEARREAIRYGVGSISFRLGLALIALGGLLLAAILLILFKQAATEKPRYAVKFTKLIKDNKKFAWFMTILSVAFIILGFYLYLSSNGEVNNKNNIEPNTIPQTDQTVPASESAETKDTDQKEVKGVSTQKAAEFVTDERSSGLVVEKPGTPGLYPIFSEPNYGAEIIYEAEDGETFTVTSMEGEWYKVILEDGSSGWLHQTSVGNR